MFKEVIQIMKVGIPVMKCSLNPSGQVNKRTGKSSKTCGLSAAWLEMNNERLGRDQTIDKELTYKNVWMIGDTSDNIPEIVKKEIAYINAERIKNGKKSLRKDCVSVAEIIEKPPITYMENLSYEEKVQFLKDSHTVMSDLIYNWNPNWKIIASVQHHDEFGGRSPHNHELVLLSTIDKDGLPNMQAKSELNLKFFNYINKNYPEKMRNLGYDIEDVRTYDLLSEEEKKERKLHPDEHGVDSYIYKKKKEKELTQKLEQLQQENENTIEELQMKKQELITFTDAPDLRSYENIVKENKELKKEISIKNKLIEELKAGVEYWKNAATEWKKKMYEFIEKTNQKIISLMTYKSQDTVNKQTTIEDLVKKVDQSIKERDPEEYEKNETLYYPGYYKDLARKFIKDGNYNKLNELLGNTLNNNIELQNSLNTFNAELKQFEISKKELSYHQ